MKNTVVKIWTTTAGLPAMIILTPMGSHCGYVGVPPEHPAHGMDYDQPLLEDIEVHGGLTYASKPPLQEGSDYWALGYDCAHLGDLVPSISTALNVYRMFDEGIEGANGDVWRDEAYCTGQCESLAEQLRALGQPALALPAPNWVE